MGFVPKWSRGDQKKTSPSSSQPGVRQMPSLFHGAKDAQYSGPKLFADGGEVSEDVLKSEGLKASEGEKVGFLERLKAGNIDDPGSEAYKRFGAGRGRAERDAAAAFRQMDDIESSRDSQMRRMNEQAAAESAKVEVTPLPEPEPIKAKPIAPSRPAASKPASKPVDWKAAPNESEIENRRNAEAVRRAVERAEVPTPSPKVASVPPRPAYSLGNIAERRGWDMKYRKTHYEDGTPK